MVTNKISNPALSPNSLGHRFLATLAVAAPELRGLSLTEVAERLRRDSGELIKLVHAANITPHSPEKLLPSSKNLDEFLDRFDDDPLILSFRIYYRTPKAKKPDIPLCRSIAETLEAFPPRMKMTLGKLLDRLSPKTGAAPQPAPEPPSGPAPVSALFKGMSRDQFAIRFGKYVWSLPVNAVFSSSPSQHLRNFAAGKDIDDPELVHVCMGRVFCTVNREIGRTLGGTKMKHALEHQISSGSPKPTAAGKGLLSYQDPEQTKKWILGALNTTDTVFREWLELAAGYPELADRTLLGEFDALNAGTKSFFSALIAEKVKAVFAGVRNSLMTLGAPSQEAFLRLAHQRMGLPAQDILAWGERLTVLGWGFFIPRS